VKRFDKTVRYRSRRRHRGLGGPSRLVFMAVARSPIASHALLGPPTRIN